MSGKSDYLADLFLAWVKGAAMPAAPASVYVGLYDGEPGAGGIEVTSTIRPAGRVAVTFGSASVNAGSTSIASAAAVAFGIAGGAAEVTHFVIFDAAAAGHLLYSSEITGGALEVVAGQYLVFPAGSLVLREA